MTIKTGYRCPACEDMFWEVDGTGDAEDLVYHTWHGMANEFSISSITVEKMGITCPWCLGKVMSTEEREQLWVCAKLDARESEYHRLLASLYDKHLHECAKYRLHQVAGTHPKRVELAELCFLFPDLRLKM